MVDSNNKMKFIGSSFDFPVQGFYELCDPATVLTRQ